MAVKEIVLKNGGTAIVDDDTFPFLSKFHWNILKGKYDKSGYAYRGISVQGKSFCVFMHHMVKPRLKGFVTDHVNKNSLDNRSENLRYLTHKQNCSGLPNPEKKIQTHCLKGHLYDDKNTYHWRNGRRCRTCGNNRSKNYKRRQRKKLKNGGI